MVLLIIFVRNVNMNYHLTRGCKDTFTFGNFLRTCALRWEFIKWGIHIENFFLKVVFLFLNVKVVRRKLLVAISNAFLTVVGSK